MERERDIARERERERERERVIEEEFKNMPPVKFWKEAQRSDALLQQQEKEREQQLALEHAKDPLSFKISGSIYSLPPNPFIDLSDNEDDEQSLQSSSLNSHTEYSEETINEMIATANMLATAFAPQNDLGIDENTINSLDSAGAEAESEKEMGGVQGHSNVEQLCKNINDTIHLIDENELDDSDVQTALSGLNSQPLQATSSLSHSHSFTQTEFFHTNNERQKDLFTQTSQSLTNSLPKSLFVTVSDSDIPLNVTLCR